MKTFYKAALMVSLLGLCRSVRGAGAPALPGPDANAMHSVVAPEMPQADVLLNSDLSGVRVFPQPWRKDKHHDFPITFDRLSTQATITIFSLSGHRIRTLETDNGTASWDLTNDSGDTVASGIYLYLISNEDGQETKGKLAIIR